MGGLRSWVGYLGRDMGGRVEVMGGVSRSGHGWKGGGRG